MTNSNHYVPILKWKRAEQSALKALAEKQKKCYNPLVQLVMPKHKPDEQLKMLLLNSKNNYLKYPKN